MRRARVSLVTALAVLFPLAGLSPRAAQAAGPPVRVAQAASSGAVDPPRVPAQTRLASLTPARLLDTRTGNGAPAAMRAAGSALTVKVTGRGGVPATGATAIVANVTAVTPQGPGYVTAYPSDTPRPTASNLNYGTGRTIANQVVLRPAPDGTVTLYTSARTHLLLDVTAYYPAGASYRPLTPKRVLDTRSGAMPGADSSTHVPLLGVAGVPSSGVKAVVVNVTAVRPTSTGYLTVQPESGLRTTSTVNYTAGRDTAGLAMVRPGYDGSAAVDVSSSTHVLVDVVGWVPEVSEYATILMSPAWQGFNAPDQPLRIVDTRLGLGAPRARVPAGGQLSVQVTGPGGAPTDASAVELNVTAVNPTMTGWLQVWPAGAAKPTASTVNYPSRTTIANSVTAKVGAGGRVTIASSAQADVLVDVSGYWIGIPDPTFGAHRASTIAGGDAHTCAVSDTGLVQCWGSNAGGQLGNGTTNVWATTPATVPNLTGVTALSASADHTCAVSGGHVYCWGGRTEADPAAGIPASGTTRPTLVNGLTGVTAIASGRGHDCALASGAVFCWGDNGYGQLGVNSDTTYASATPVKVAGLSGPATAIATGGTSSCAITSAGTVQCWGLGLSDSSGNTVPGGASWTPRTISGLDGPATAMAANGDDGGGHYFSNEACAITTTGSVFCWGAVSFRDGATSAPWSATKITGLDSSATRISVGRHHVCATTQTGSLYCWGSFGGDSVPASSGVPTRVASAPTGITRLVSGADHACAVTSVGSAHCWGFDMAGQLGDGTTASAAAPQRVVGY